MKVLVTRSEPAASRTAEKLRKAGFDPVVIPLFEVVDTGNTVPNDGYGGIIFTSNNAISVLGKRGWKPSPDFGVAYCVGKTTANAAEALGFQRVVTAEGGGQALANLMMNDGSELPNRLLYPAPTKRAFDMVAALEGSGVLVDMVEIYEHRVVEDGAALLKEKSKDAMDWCVTAYSAKSAIVTAECVFGEKASSRDRGPYLVAISENCANSVLKYPWRDVYVAVAPNEQAMINEIKKLTLRKGE